MSKEKFSNNLVLSLNLHKKKCWVKSSTNMKKTFLLCSVLDFKLLKQELLAFHFDLVSVDYERKYSKSQIGQTDRTFTVIVTTSYWWVGWKRFTQAITPLFGLCNVYKYIIHISFVFTFPIHCFFYINFLFLFVL